MHSKEEIGENGGRVEEANGSATQMSAIASMNGTCTEKQKSEQHGWDAVTLVDPGFESLRLNSGSAFLRDPEVYKDRADLWSHCNLDQSW
jgi:hypothetical protein